ncbi:senecionine N-oxygenase-like [Neocloeon triangulifer]|uniref:senecionine N-oxygenase-like n=1 Tax=Neocloeon triangulifer TaxID=2078957 RepID=UPI00286EF610|nr:senecionine N-oxygenase-like [Neocloeon triangulifer]
MERVKLRKRVAIIGAGVAGLAAARHFTAPGSPFECQVFEQDNNVGGTWRLSDYVGTDEIGRPVHSSMYKYLRMNLPKEIMCYPDFAFSSDSDGVSYITSQQFLDYTEEYADHFQLQKHIKFNHGVKEVKPLTGANGETEWQVTVYNWLTKETTTHIFYAVMVCNGHFCTPNIPDFEGSNKFNGKIVHSHDYRDPEDFKGKRVLIVGGSFSAIDITVDVAKWADHVVMSHHLKEFTPDYPDNVSLVPDIKNFTKNGALFVNGEEKNFDTVILCTGFKYNFPFLHESCKITTNGYGVEVEPLYKHMINIEYPSMCFISICNYNLPAQLSDLQSRYFYSLLSGISNLPSKEEMYADLREDQKHRIEKLRWPAQQAHKLGPLQEKLYSEIATACGAEGIKPVTLKMFIDCVVANSKFQDLQHFRDRRFTIIDNNTYEATPPFSSLETK